MNPKSKTLLPFQMADLGVWWWVLICVLIGVSLQWPVILLFIVLLVWRAAELWFTWNVLSQTDRTRW